MPFPFQPRYVDLEERGHLLIVTFSRPKAMNSMPAAMHCELSKIFRYFDTNDSLWVAIVTGKGRAFSAGFDLKSAAGLAPKEDMEIDVVTGIDLSAQGGGTPGKKDGQGIPGGTGFAGLTERKGIKPVIAAVNGIAHGGGFETALACDVLIASERADFALPEPKVGLYAAAGGVVRLPRLIGFHNAMSMILTGRRVKASEAKSLGICQYVVPHGDLMKSAMEFADKILACSPDAIQASLQVAKRSMAEELSMVDAITIANRYPAAVRMFKGPNTQEGPTAFSEKRKPNWCAPEPLGNFMSSSKL
eukprot:g5689.t1